MIPVGSPAAHPEMHPEIESVLMSEQAIAERVRELAAQVDADYAGREILLVGVLKGAVMFMADLARALDLYPAAYALHDRSETPADYRDND